MISSMTAHGHVNVSR